VLRANWSFRIGRQQLGKLVIEILDGEYGLTAEPHIGNGAVKRGQVELADFSDTDDGFANRTVQNDGFFAGSASMRLTAKSWESIQIVPRYRNLVSPQWFNPASRKAAVPHRHRTPSKEKR